MKHLTEYVYANVQPKQLFSRTLTGSNFAHLAISYVQAMNSGGMPVIRSAWENVIVAECDRFLTDSLKQWDREWDTQVVAHLPMEDRELRDRFWEIQDQLVSGLRKFVADKQVTADVSWAVESKLLAVMRKSFNGGLEVNYTKSQRESERALSKAMDHVMTTLDAEDVSFEKFESELSISLKEHVRRIRSPSLP